MLKDMGFQVVSIWGHEWKEMVSKDPAIKDYIDSLDIQDRLSPREAFYGKDLLYQLNVKTNFYPDKVTALLCS